MKRFLWLVVALWPLLTAQTFAGKPYSAESVTRIKGHEVVSRVYVGGQDRWRVEAGQGAQGVITIVRVDKKMLYTVLPQAKSYYTLPMTDEDAKPDTDLVPAPSGAKVTRRLLGSEQVNGRPTQKYEVTVTSPGHKPQVHYEWLSKELGMPLKIEAADKSWATEFRNIRLGAQDARLFEVPGGYTRMAIPGMGGR